MSIVWCHPTDKQTNSIWYFKGEKCEVTRLGIENRRVKIIEVRTESGAIIPVMCSDGDYPGLEYEVLH